MKEQKLIAVRSEAGSAAQGLISNIVLIANDTGAKNICLTGGEPLLQPKDELVDLVKSLVENWDYTLEMFSNGTLEYPRALMHHCAIRVDWKLPGSQEAQSGTNWDQRVNNYYAMGEWDHHTIKFTIKNQADFEAAMAIYEKFDMEAWPGTIYAGPVWESDIAAKDIVDGILTCRLPWRLNMQIHNHVWPPQERGH
jgi:7-carboxy-7-deazaguanine synthase